MLSREEIQKTCSACDGEGCQRGLGLENLAAQAELAIDLLAALKRLHQSTASLKETAIANGLLSSGHRQDLWNRQRHTQALIARAEALGKPVTSAPYDPWVP